LSDIQNKTFTNNQIKQKMEFFCSYQERCHDEVNSKLYSYKLDESERNQVIVYLIENDFLNETRFACAFARGKQMIKHWGRIRIVNELKFRHVSAFNIKTALKEFSEAQYQESFHNLADKNWQSIRETNVNKKRKKFCDFMLRKGYESNLVYEKLKDLEKL
jgi:regulatory protein